MRNLSIAFVAAVLSIFTNNAWSYIAGPLNVDMGCKPEECDVVWQHKGREVIGGLREGDVSFFRLCGSGNSGKKCGNVRGYNYYSLSGLTTDIGRLAFDPARPIELEIKCRILDFCGTHKADGQNILIYYGSIDDGETPGSYRHSIGFIEAGGVKKVRLSLRDEFELELDWGKWHTYRIFVSPENPSQADFTIHDSDGVLVHEIRELRTGDGRLYLYGDAVFGDGSGTSEETIWDVAQVKVAQPQKQGACMEDNARNQSDVSLQAAMNLGTNSQLVINDSLIESSKNVELKCTTAKKSGRPVLYFDRPWEYQPTCSFISVLKEDGIFKMWYWVGGIEESRKPGSGIKQEDNSFICYAESKDGIHWNKPDLGVIDFKGSTKNNIILRHHGSHVDSFSILKASWESDPAKKYKMVAYHGTWPYQGGYKKLGYKYPPGHFLYYSSDGICWTLAQEQPIAYLSTGDRISPSQLTALDATSFCVDEAREKYVGFLKRSINGKRVRFYTESDDAINWSTPVLCIQADSKDIRNETQIYYNNGFDYESLWLGIAMLYYPGTTETMDTQLVYSVDGQKWNRVPDRKSKIIGLGAANSWDSKMIWVNSTPPVEVGDELWFYYGGLSIKHNLSNANSGNPQWGAIGMAKVMRDRFAALTAYGVGEIVTSPLILKGGKLFVNADIKGELRVEILDENGAVIPGFSVDECKAVVGDSISHEIEWASGETVGKLAGETLKIRFVLRKGSIFAFKVK